MGVSSRYTQCNRKLNSRTSQRRRCIGAKERKANEYFADNRRFADMCNAVLFGGRTVILPEALEATDTTELLSVLGMDGKEISFQKWRD